MRHFLKKYLKPILIRAGIPLTKNMRYDQQARRIMKRILNEDSNCIDVGCHVGEFMDWMLEMAPKGRHSGFEPIPWLFEGLKHKYGNRVRLYDAALSSAPGQAHFQVVKNAPAYSGLRRRKYAVEKPDIEEVQVRVETLDRLFEASDPIRLLKVDVEGAEFDVLRGAENLLRRDRPYVLFEYGLGSAEFYDSGPDAMYQYLQSVGLSLHCLGGFLKGAAPLTASEFMQHFQSGSEYYFLAVPQQN